MRKTILFNDNWQFIKTKPEVSEKEIISSDKWQPVDIPHDWLIYDSKNLYEDSEGWYHKILEFEPVDGNRYALRFDGVYMDSTVYVNGIKAGAWKYGYNTFEFEITDLLKKGTNEIFVRVVFKHPNSRWYSGAGIYRNIWFKEMPETHIVSDGIYIRTVKAEKGFNVRVSTEVAGSLSNEASMQYEILDADGKIVAEEEFRPNSTEIINVDNPVLWSTDNPYLYTLRAKVCIGEEVIDSTDTRFGFRTIRFDSEHGFFLNEKHVKLNGACMHHDLGCLGAAVNKTAIKRQLEMLKSMGINAIRTSHNMPAPELMELADEMGILINNEFFDMWKIKKNEYDYARFFDEWAEKDVCNFVRRDRNHPCLIMWSIGNEIYDTHADLEEGYATTKRLRDAVLMHDPERNAYVTFGSNFLEGENTQKCAELLGLVGYNYAERLYAEHHKKHPDWVIYGSETGSTLQSRSVYHFPYSEPILTDLDEQCSSLGNSTCSWGAKNTEFCIITERDTEYSAGQFIWTGFDYIGEPTPYQTKNSYFGQIDTAGFPKDTYYIYKAEWTDYKKDPMVHIFPYWDFNEGQIIDIRVTSNAPRIELFFNGESQGTFDIDHAHGTELLGHWQLPYHKGRLEAVAYDENGNIIARDVQESFKDADSIVLKPDKTEMKADGEDLVFIEINMADEDGHEVKNANNRVTVNVSGAGRLIGLDNGDSTDYDSYKGTSRKLFMGKLLAVVAADTVAGDINVEVSSQGVKSASVIIKSVQADVAEGISASAANVSSEPDDEVPIRKIVLHSEKGLRMGPDLSEIRLEAELLPKNCTCDELEWAVVNDSGVETNIATIVPDKTGAVITALGDGKFNVRCYSRNNGEKVNVISQVGISVEGLGFAFINPYESVQAALYTISKGELGNAEEHGIATQKQAESYIGFENVDFGKAGTDEFEISIFTFNSQDYEIQVWSGVPGEPGSRILVDGIYNKPVIWGVYQPERYKTKECVTGIHNIFIRTTDFVNIRDFSFIPLNRGTKLNYAADHDSIYGDDFKISGRSVCGIGNNVSIRFEDMDFGEGVNSISIQGRSYIDVNTLNVLFTSEDGKESREMIEFTYTDESEEKTFEIRLVKGRNTVTFVFLPGSNFDFDWFQFK